MVRLIPAPVHLLHDSLLVEGEASGDRLARACLDAGLPPLPAASDGDGTMAGAILAAHDKGPGGEELRLGFDALASHDITYVGIVQTARASGLDRFPLPYVLTNCHNSLCAVGGTINEDDHLFGLSAARRYGGIFVPPHLAVIHQYMRERHASCGAMILGSDSHTRYGALGTMGVGEGGPELVKQLLGKTWDLKRPSVVLVWLTGAPRPGVGPQDVALALIAATFKNGFVNNKVLEVSGPGVSSLSVDYRLGIDVMTTETTCLSSVWKTDAAVSGWLSMHGRPDAYRPLRPAPVARYDGAVVVDLSAVRPMIALPFHPSNACAIEEFNANAADMLRQVEKESEKAMEAPGVRMDLVSKLEDGKLRADQGVIAGCAGGTFENISIAARLIAGKSLGHGAFGLSVYPSSQPVLLELARNGEAAALMAAGAVLRSAFCGPCFGAGDVPAHQGLSLRHTTRNFPNREGSRPADGQAASVALMDARSIAATALNGGILTPATDMEWPEPASYSFDASPYDHRVYAGFGKPEPSYPLRFGPNIADWPPMAALTRNLVLEIVSAIRDAVTTTDELIPSGETSSYRSNPLRLAEFTLSRKDPGYVGRAKAVRAQEEARREKKPASMLGELSRATGLSLTGEDTGIGSAVFALRPGDGSAREQAASCQKVLGGWANVAVEYATKRYRSNLVNWGMLPFQCSAEDASRLAVGSRLVVPGIREAVERGRTEIEARLVAPDGKVSPMTLRLPLSGTERPIILAGSLINFYKG